jgi:peroxiredoxin
MGNFFTSALSSLVESAISDETIDSMITGHLKSKGYDPVKGLKPVIAAQSEPMTLGALFPNEKLPRFGKDNKVETFQSRGEILGKRVLVITIPGIANRDDSDEKMKGYVALADDLKKQGIEKIYFLSVDKHGTMADWAQKLDAKGIIGLFPDNWGKITFQLGLGEASELLGLVAKRAALVFNKKAELEWKAKDNKPDALDLTTATAVLASLKAAAPKEATENSGAGSSSSAASQPATCPVKKEAKKA